MAKFIYIAIPILFCLGACKENELGQKPQNSANTPTFETTPSTIGALFVIKMTKLSELVNSGIVNKV